VPGNATVSAVVVGYDEHPDELREAVDGLRAQSRPPDEILVVDNGTGELAAALEGYAPELRVLRPGANLGYPPAIDYAATRASGDYLFCLNPDARAEPNCLRLLLDAAESDPSVAVAGAQILFPDAETTSAGANPLHPTGVSPSGRYGEPREYGEPRDTIVVSGACCLMRRETFLALGGFVEEFFLYYDDADFGWRARIAGHRVVFCPEAVARHGYEFARRGRKWFYLERNRIFSVLSNYEARTLLLLTPLLVATEIALLAVAALQGWLPEKLRAYGSVWALRRAVLRQRRRVSASRRRSDRELAPLFATRLHSPFLPAAPTRVANAVTTAYMRALYGSSR
jgi:GT2 family glycosyltransferase